MIAPSVSPIVHMNQGFNDSKGYPTMNISKVTSILTVAFCAGAVVARAADPLMMVLSYQDKTLSIFRVAGKTLSPAGVIPVGNGARESCVSADGRRAYVSNEKENTISVIDLEGMKEVAKIAPPGLKRPDGCATTSDSKKLYVTGLESNEVLIISTDTNTVTGRFPLGKEPRRIIRTPDAKRLLIASEGTSTIFVLDPTTDKIVDEIHSGGQGPRAMTFLPDGKTLFNANVDDDTVTFTTLATKDKYLTIGCGGAPQRVAVSSDGKFAYVLSGLENKISIINLKVEHIRASKFVSTGNQPVGMTLSSDGSLLFVSSMKENTVTAFDPVSMEQIAQVKVPVPMGISIR